MPTLERIVQKIYECSHEIHKNFRLFLSSMPSKSFPVSILQNGVKVISEPPKGLRGNLKRAFQDIDINLFEKNILKLDWRKMIFGLCFFHAIVLERKKFGSLGWNTKYEFSDTDCICALEILKVTCKDGHIYWDALEYLTAEIIYGGRVTDFWDQRCLRTVLKGFFSSESLKRGYKYSSTGIYYAPEATTIEEYRTYIDNLPMIDEPEIFGMHENANITFQVNETAKLISTILEVQPKSHAIGIGKYDDEMIFQMASDILGKLDDKLECDDIGDKCIESSLTIVLLQEVERYNKLLFIIKNSLKLLQKAIRGFVVMSENLEDIYGTFLINQVPLLWSKSSYLSMKSLGSWVNDLVLRIDFFKNWAMYGNPVSFWLPGFFFQQGFLTGVLQNHARKYKHPIDQLSFNFHVKPYYLSQAEFSKSLKAAKENYDYSVLNIHPPQNGVLVHGLYLDAADFDILTMKLCDAQPGVMNPSLPLLHLEPEINYEPPARYYIAPLYKTAERAGTLSTTGHSTNFIIPVHLPSAHPQSFWIKRGSAILCEITD